MVATIQSSLSSLSSLARTLVQKGRLLPVDAEAIQAKAASSGIGFVEQLIQTNKIRAVEVCEFVSQTFGYPQLDLNAIDSGHFPKGVLDEKIMRGGRALPLFKRGNRLFVGLSDPTNLAVLDEIKFKTGLTVEPVAVEDDKLGPLINKAVESAEANIDKLVAQDSGSIGDLLGNLDEEVAEEGVGDDVSAAADNELVKLVNKIVVDAYNQGASDIHIEPRPGKQKTKIRFRKDGSLLPYIEVPSNYRQALIARIKIMCDLDISEKRKPQDGKIKFKKFGPLDVELRVATCPTQGGMEDVVMRILSAGKPIPIDNLGLNARNLKTLKEIVSKPYGFFLVCGPTGSGKTTTLHSVLSYLNTPETKIWTAEDPVEITQEGLRQVQMNPKAGLNFATAMRAFLRCDPDVIMVGEMRDKETVSIGIEASLTGHLVFATLHTNSAPESIVRLLDMGMDPFNFADALLGVLAQRLAKQICSSCKKAHVATADETKLLLMEYCEELKNTPVWQKDPNAAIKEIHGEWVKQFADNKGQFTLYEPVGCDNCSGTGYRGRIGLHELLVGTDMLKKNIQEHARVAEILVTALSEGMRTLKQDGIEKVLHGLTDMHQVRAVCIK
ncbi:MAG TPA: ATPase, T2SS/T4P/T4SS family [Burkholderiales bacterium]|nr:ATPase, T2SS/T4P/T4SS family [Burkholderiales bacterium]